MAPHRPLWERLLGALGVNTTRLRWKLQQRQIERERKENREQNEGRALRYEHKLCPSCSLTVDRDAKTCPRCQRPLASATMTRLGRHLRRVFPEGSYSYSLFFVAVNVIFYVAMVLQSGGPEALFSGPSNRVALRFGAWFIPLVLQGEWWRLVTPTFLHFGTLHLVFNCLWLAQLGPGLEQLLGRSRFLVLYVVTGVGGFVVSIGYRLFSGSIGGIGGGASGVVFGLIAAALTLAYVRKAPGTSFFKEGLLKWAVFGIVISFLPGIDLAAHLGGALFGGLLGLGMATADQARRLPDRLWLALEILCLLLVLASFALTVVRPPMELLTR
jgi:rhomboid protease GluP